MFQLTINTAGAAFTVESNDEENGTPNPGPELARLLRTLADKIDQGAADWSGATIRERRGTLVDTNGSSVGRWSLSLD